MTTTSPTSAPERKHSSPQTHNSEHNNDDSPATSSTSKRKSSSAGGGATNDAQQDENNKKKRRKVNHACVYCRRSHMTCDLERPCARCVKRDIGHLCHDEPREPPRRSKSEIGVGGGVGGAQEIAPAPDGDEMKGMNGGGAFAQHQASVTSGTGMDGTQLAQPTPLSPTQLQRTAPNPGANNANTSTFLSDFDWNNSGVHNQFQDMHHLHPNYMFNTSEVTNEYNMLNDFLSTSLLDDGGMYSNEDAQAFLNDPLLATSSVAAMSNFQFPGGATSAGASGNGQAAASLQPQPLPTLAPPPSNNNKAAGEEISRPSSAFPISEQSRNKFYMTAADPAGLSSAEDRLHKLLKAKYDAGMLKPFNYVKGYARLNAYMAQNLSRESQLRILKQLDRFRPKFREAMQSLTDMQLVLVEMWFERSLMEYDRVFASMAIPACCWRRTGEIFRGNREMAELIGVPWEKLRDGKLAIHEIIAEDSLVSYWEKFGAIAFDQSQKAILTSCSLMTPKWDEGDSGGKEIGTGGGTSNEKSTGGQGPGGGKKDQKKVGETVKCCFSFTIRRDTHNIPSLIVGNFLPIRQRPFCTYQASRPV